MLDFQLTQGRRYFLNTFSDSLEEVAERLRAGGFGNTIVGKVGGKLRLSEEHLFSHNAWRVWLPYYGLPPH